jgi:methylphosphotriester-DNA--protein-cysteine methyltransferase
MRRIAIALSALCLAVLIAHTACPAAGTDTDDKKSADASKAVEKKAEADPRDEAVVTSKNSKVYHRPDCHWAKRIKADNLKKYKSGHEAELDDLRPCKRCFKELYKTDDEKTDGEKKEDDKKE